MADYRILIKEVRYGSVSFPTKEEAEQWLNDEGSQDWGLVEWNASEITAMNREY